MTERYKIMHNMERMDRKKFFSLSHNTTAKNHSMKLIGTTFRTDKRR